MLEQSKKIFTSFAVNIGLIMVTDSAYTLVAPYLWIIKAISTESYLYTYYDVSLELFFMMNTVFSIFMLYALYFFQRLASNPERASAAMTNSVLDRS
jgi:hypothetical protein